MNLEKTIKSLEQKLYTVKCFDTHEEAADYLDSQIDGKIVGFGDSRTIIDMKLYDKLSKHNTVYDPNQSVDNDGLPGTQCGRTEEFAEIRSSDPLRRQLQENGSVKMFRLPQTGTNLQRHHHIHEKDERH